MQERAKISRRQILQGAADRFEVTGYGSTSMNDIVSAAQMTKGAVYFHFSSKDELAQAVIEEQHQISISAFTAVAATGAPALEQLVMVCHEMGRQLVAEPIVRAGIRLTLELASADGSQGPYVAWIRELRKLAEAAKLEGVAKVHEYLRAGDVFQVIQPHEAVGIDFPDFTVDADTTSFIKNHAGITAEVMQAKTRLRHGLADEFLPAHPAMIRAGTLQGAVNEDQRRGGVHGRSGKKIITLRQPLR